MARSILAACANLFANEDIAVSVLAMSGFLTYAASGTVTYVDQNGNTQTVYVTPDPSIPAQNPTGALGALDVLANDVYNVQRILSSPAGGAHAILNTSGNTYGPFTAGTYHVGQPGAVGQPTYSNAASLTIAPSAYAGGVAVGNVSAATNASPIVVTSNGHGLSNGATVYITGALGNTAANGAWVVSGVTANTFTLVGSSGNGAYTVGSATAYVPTVAAFAADVSGSASSAAVNTVTATVTSLVGVSCSNPAAWTGTDTQSNTSLANTCRLKLQALSPNGPKGAYQYFALNAVSVGLSIIPQAIVSTPINRPPLVVNDYTTGTPTVTIANASGPPTASDVTAVTAVLQAECVPSTVTLACQAAAAASVTVVLNLWVPAAQVTAATTIASAATSAYFANLAIGGVTDPGTSTANVVPIQGYIDAVVQALGASNITVQDASATFNGSAANVQLVLTPVPQVATINGTPTLNVTGY
jgi:hypothetical protein